MALTGRKLLEEAGRNKKYPTTVGFGEFIKDYIYEFHGFTKPVEPSLEKIISDFVADWCRRVTILFRDKKYQGKLQLFLEGNHPAYFDREIRFVNPRPTPQTSGRREIFSNLASI